MESECCGCEAVPCDCGQPIWNFRFWAGRTDHRPSWNINDPTKLSRKEALAEWRRSNGNGFEGVRAKYQFGPVQRITEPPYEFDVPSITATTSPLKPATGYTVPVPMPQPSCCALSWCPKPAASHTPRETERCVDFAGRKVAIENRRDEFVARMTARFEAMPLAAAAQHAVEGEIEWARKRTDEELTALQQSYRAVQHEEAAGDPKYFAHGGRR